MENRTVINGHYMYGNTFIQPEIMGYAQWPHTHGNMAPSGFCNTGYPDINYGYSSSPNTVNPTGCTMCDAYGNHINCTTCNLCNALNNGNTVNTIPDFVGLETVCSRNVKFNIYKMDSANNKTVQVNIGDFVKIAYMSDHGMLSITGKVTAISESIPDGCTRFMGGASSIASSAYLTIDASTVGSYAVYMIYISTIRDIEIITPAEDTTVGIEPTETMVDKILANNELMAALLEKINAGEGIVKCDVCHPTEEAPVEEETATDAE